jgi:hypothetical protein
MMLLEEIKYSEFDSGLEIVDITSDFDLLLHVEYPILYTGKNAYGSRIIGSFLEEDEVDLTALYYIHFIIKNIDYTDFLAQRISYRDIFKLAKTAFILKKDLASLKIEKVFSIQAEYIPGDYLPHKKSLHPRKGHKSSLTYKLSLGGGIADDFHAFPKDLIDVQGAFTDVLSQTFSDLPDLSLQVGVYQNVYTEGSFQLNFEVKVEPDKADLFFNKATLSDYQNHIIDYIINSLSTEATELYSNESIPPIFQTLLDKANSIYSALNISVDANNLQESIKHTIHNTANNIIKACNAIGTNYDTLTFNCIVENGENGFIASITPQSKDELINAVDNIDDILTPEDDTVTDEEPQNYKVLIYSLNTKTRNGTGIFVAENGDTFEPKISITGSEPLSGTRFTKSLDKDTIIDVLAIGTTKNGKLKRLLISF